VPDELSIDSSHVKAHRSAAGPKKGEYEEAIGRSRGGRTCKIHCLADDRSRPVAFALTPGNIAHGLAPNALSDRQTRLPAQERHRTPLRTSQTPATHRHQI
jgi:hypothetical protein